MLMLVLVLVLVLVLGLQLVLGLELVLGLQLVLERLRMRRLLKDVEGEIVANRLCNAVILWWNMETHGVPDGQVCRRLRSRVCDRVHSKLHGV